MAEDPTHVNAYGLGGFSLVDRARGKAATLSVSALLLKSWHDIDFSTPYEVA